MKLSKWAKQQGISYTTAYRWFKAGRIPSAKQLDNGTILVPGNDNLSNAEIKLKQIREILDATDE